MFKNRLNLRKAVAIAICFAGTATLFAQEETGININGVIWATRNVGAPGTFVDKPEDAGMFYQWGKNVGWSTTNPLVNSNGSNTWETNRMSGDFWTADNDPCPNGWRVPTGSELSVMEIGNIVPSTWTTLNGVNGRVFGTAPNTIFLPAAGYRYYSDGDLLSVGSGGYYWEGRQYDSQLGWVGRLRFTNTQTGFAGVSRTYAYCIRCVKNNTTGVNVVSVDSETATVLGYYDILGRKLKEEPATGLYIIQYDNGKTKKIMKQ